MDLIQNSFAGGEISPLLEGRTDLPKYSISVRKLRNMFCHVTGPASNRPGTKYIYETKDNTKKSRLIPFKFGTSQMYQLEFGNQYIRFYKDEGIILAKDNALDFDPVTAYSVDWYIRLGHNLTYTYTGSKNLSFALPYGLTGSSTIKIATQANTGDTLAVTASGDTITVKFANATWQKNYAGLIQTAIRALGTVNGVSVAGCTVTANAAYTAAPALAGTMAATALSGGNKLYRALQAVTSAANNTSFFPATEAAYWADTTIGSPVEVVSPYLEADLPYIKCVQSADTMFMTCPGYAPRQLVRYSHCNWNLSTFNFLHGPFMTANLSAVTITPSGTTGSITLTASAALFNSGHVGSWWRVGAVVSGAYGDVKITAVTDSTHANATVQNTLSGTSAFTNWAEGSWSTYRGWPQSICFYQDRLCFGNTLSEPQTVWFSKTSDYTNFSKASPLVDSDTISISLPSREVHAIQNLVNLGDVMAITDEGIWWIGPNSSSAAFTPTTVKSKFQYKGGGNYISPVIFGNTAVYVSASGGEMLYTDYNEGQSGINSYTGGSLSMFYDHLLSLSGRSVIDLVFQESPAPLIQAVRDDGKIICVTVNKEQQVNGAGIWDFEYGDAICESASVIPETGYSDVWYIVKHGDKRYVEQLQNRVTSTDPADQFYVDCGLSLDVPITITGISLSTTITITAANHGLSNDDLVDLSDIVWTPNVDYLGNRTQPDQLNGFQWKVADADTNTFTIKDPEDDSYLDGSNYKVYVSGGYARKAVSSVSGLDHLEGKTVAVLANGNVLGNKTVSSGSIDLEISASRIHVGLPYISDIETLKPGLQLNTGTSLTKNIAYPKTTLLFYNSGGGWIGENNTSMTELTQRTSEVLGQTTALVNGFQEVDTGIPANKDARLYFRQLDPLPVTLVAIMPKTEIGGN